MSAAAASTKSRKFRRLPQKNRQAEEREAANGDGLQRNNANNATNAQNTPGPWPESATHNRNPGRHYDELVALPMSGVCGGAGVQGVGTPFDIIKSARRLRN